MFHVKAHWLYVEASHGKDPRDGVGCVSKRRADDAIKSKQATVIDCAEHYFKWAKEDISSK